MTTTRNDVRTNGAQGTAPPNELMPIFCGNFRIHFMNLVSIERKISSPPHSLTVFDVYHLAEISMRFVEVLKACGLNVELNSAITICFALRQTKIAHNFDEMTEKCGFN